MAERPPTPEALAILRSLWRGAELMAYWSEWPEGRERPLWLGVLSHSDGVIDHPSCSEVLEELLIGGYVTRTRLQHRGDRRAWHLSDRGLAALGLPSQDAVRSVDRREVACG